MLRALAAAGFVVGNSLIDNAELRILSLARVVGTDDHRGLGVVSCVRMTVSQFTEATALVVTR
jgi:hypothetical protein